MLPLARRRPGVDHYYIKVRSGMPVVYIEAPKPYFNKREFSFLIIRSIHGVLQGVLGLLLHPLLVRPLIKIHDGLFYRFLFSLLLPVALSVILIELEISWVRFSSETRVTKRMLWNDRDALLT